MTVPDDFAQLWRYVSKAAWLPVKETTTATRTIALPDRFSPVPISPVLTTLSD